jgi:hypothetical protein
MCQGCSWRRSPTDGYGDVQVVAELLGYDNPQMQKGVRPHERRRKADNAWHKACTPRVWHAVALLSIEPLGSSLFGIAYLRSLSAFQVFLQQSSDPGG